MFMIEYVVAHERANPSVVYRVDTRAYTVRVVEQVARGTLDVVRRMFPKTPPDGFQIFDDDDEVVSRSWESVSRRRPFGTLARKSVHTVTTHDRGAGSPPRAVPADESP